MRRILVIGVPVVVAVLALTRVQAQRTPAESWPNYQHNSNFSPLTQITPENVTRLTKAWTFNYGGGNLENVPFVGLDYRFQVQPLVIDDVMYFSTPASERDPNLLSTVTALEPETGRVIWQYKSPRRIHGRGLAYWKGSAATGPRLFFATDKGYLMGLDLKTGQLATGFGKGGEVDVYVGVASPAVPDNRRDTFTVPNPVTVYKNLLITGTRPGELPPPQPRGDIRAWDAATGKLVWSFHTVPWPGEPHHEDWPGDTWKDRSGCNVWSNLTADETTGLVFGATGDANRAVKGSNLYCNSLIALDAQTGKLKWFHQLVHHDASDWDMPTPPILMDVKINGRSVPAVLQTGKLHFVYMFDRVTGKPLYEFLEKPVHRSGTPDDENWPTQPVPVKTPPTGLLGMSRANINKMTPEIEKFCTDFWDQNHLIASGPFDRPAQNEAMVTFGAPVGAWGPLSYNPQLGYVFMNVTTAGTYHPAGAPVPRGFGLGNPGEDGPPGGGRAGAGPGAGAGGGRGGGGGGGTGAFSYRLPSGKTVSCVAPPYGSLVAVDANSGDIAWSVPLGINEELAELGEVGLKSGIRNIGGSIATASGLVFIGATVDRRFRAFDAKTGKELWVTELPANGNATPITYMGKDGAQYVVIAAGGGGPAARNMAVSDSVVAFKLGPAQGRGVAVAAGAGPQGRGAGAQQSDPWPGQKHLLAVADVLSGFHHDSISHALATVEQIGRRSAAYATMIRTDSQLITKGQIAGQGRYEGRGVNARTLNYYDAIFMLPSGFGTLTDQQKADLLSFVRDEGKGLIVGHATGVAFTNWPEFGEMVGGYMDSEFNANARVIVEDPKFPGAMAWGAPAFMFNDQHPVFKAPYSRDKVHVVMRLDPESLSAADRARRPDGDFPVVWARQYGKGRVFNVGWGHPDATWDDPHFQAMMLEGIKWALGVLPADVTPRPLSKPSTSPALAQAVQKDPLPEGAGKAAVVKMCGECHAVEQAVSVRGTEKDWRDVVDLMIDRGASGTPEDIRAVVAYLSKHFGPK
ncbi:MAG TPA: ThuA domain-containing protein [Vicinamibacterales bacterium]|nr:ThuA domain-containing protein [Vicinamibacterales bacterium]